MGPYTQEFECQKESNPTIFAPDTFEPNQVLKKVGLGDALIFRFKTFRSECSGFPHMFLSTNPDTVITPESFPKGLERESFG